MSQSVSKQQLIALIVYISFCVLTQPHESFIAAVKNSNSPQIHLQENDLLFTTLSVTVGRRGERKVPSKAKLVEVLFCLAGCVLSVNKHKNQSKYLPMERTCKSQLMHSNVQTETRFFSQTHEMHKCNLYEITAVSDC